MNLAQGVLVSRELSTASLTITRSGFNPISNRQQISAIPPNRIHCVYCTASDGGIMRLSEIQLKPLRTNGADSLAWRVAGLLVIVWLLAKWTWLIFAPSTVSVLPAVQQSTGIQAERLFGIAAVSGVPAQALMPNVRLVGVFAGKPGFAIMELDGKRQVGLATGREIVAGTRLVEVAMDHVVIERSGVRQQMQLEGKTSVIKSAAAASVQSIPQIAASQPLPVNAEPAAAGQAAHAAGRGDF